MIWDVLGLACFGGGIWLDWSESHPLSLLGASRVAPICSKEELVLSVGEQVAAAGVTSSGTCSNELPGVSSRPVWAQHFVLS